MAILHQDPEVYTLPQFAEAHHIVRVSPVRADRDGLCPNHDPKWPAHDLSRGGRAMETGMGRQGASLATEVGLRTRWLRSACVKSVLGAYSVQACLNGVLTGRKLLKHRGIPSGIRTRVAALKALEDHLATTEPGGALRWRYWLEISTCLDRLRTPGARWGRPAAAVNPLELLAWWDGCGGRRPLSLRDLARKLGVSEATTRKHVGAHGGHRKGGRPANPLNDYTLAAVWRTTPSITAVARTLNMSQSRVRVRLQETGLIKSSRPL